MQIGWTLYVFAQCLFLTATDNDMIDAASRCHQGVGVYA